MASKTPKKRSGSRQVAMDRTVKTGGTHTSPKGMRGYERHPKHKGTEEWR